MAVWNPRSDCASARLLHQSSILVHMTETRTTLILDDELIRLASECSGIRDYTALIHEALRALIWREAARRLIAMGGTMPKARAGRRRRSLKTR